VGAGNGGFLQKRLQHRHKVPAAVAEYFPAYVYICNKWPRNRDFVVSVGSRSDRCGLTP